MEFDEKSINNPNRLSVIDLLQNIFLVIAGIGASCIGVSILATLDLILTQISFSMTIYMTVFMTVALFSISLSIVAIKNSKSQAWVYKNKYHIPSIFITAGVILLVIILIEYFNVVDKSISVAEIILLMISQLTLTCLISFTVKIKEKEEK